MTWRTLFLDVRSGLFVPRLVTWDPETGEFTCVDGPKGSRRGRKAEEAGRFLRPVETSMADDLGAQAAEDQRLGAWSTSRYPFGS